MAGVVEERALPGCRLLDSVEHGVEAGGQGSEFRASTGDVEPSARVPGRDGIGLLDHRPDGLEHGAGQEPSPEGDGGGEEGQSIPECPLEVRFEPEWLIEAGGGSQDNRLTGGLDSEGHDTDEGAATVGSADAELATSGFPHPLTPEGAVGPDERLVVVEVTGRCQD